MVIFALMLMLEEGTAKWETLDTEVYRPLVQKEVAVDADGRIFMVCRDRAVIHIYGADGEKLKTIAGKGEGPGELKVPTWLHLMDDKLYVEDAATDSVSVFTTDGTYVSRSRWPDHDLVLAKVSDGWIYGDWETTDDRNRPIRVFWANNRFGDAREIMSWPRPAENTSVDVRSEGNQKPIIPVNPAGEEPYITTSPDGSILYLVRHDSDDLHLYNMASKKWERVIKNEGKALPFNKEWGDEKIEIMKEGLPKNMRNLVDVRPNFPEYFPLVRELTVLTDGTVAMMLWSARPDHVKPHLTFNGKGEKIKSPFSNEALTRIMAVRGDWTYVGLYDAEEEEGRIACVPTSQVNQYVKDHPEVYDGLPGTSVVVTNVN